MNRIAAVVVTYNRLVLLEKCLAAIQGQTLQQMDILIVDNASTDGTEEYCRAQAEAHRNLFYFNTGSNLGGAGGFSFGIRTAVKRGYPYLWLMDDDTIPEPEALEKLMNAAEQLNDQFGFLSSYAVWTDGTPCKMNIQGISSQWINQVDELFEKKLIPIHYASFVSLLLKAETVRSAGLPIKEFFIWGDDTEYTMRIAKKQQPGYFVYESKVLHAMRSNLNSTIVDDDSSRLGRYRYLYRNKYYLASQGMKRERILFRISIMNTIRDLLRSDREDKYKRIRIVLSSYRKGRHFHPQIEYVDDHPESAERGDTA